MRRAPSTWKPFSHYTRNQGPSWNFYLLIHEFALIKHSSNFLVQPLFPLWHKLISLQFICIYCATYAHVCSQHILLETLSGQLSIYIWFQARNWVGLSRSFSPQHWSCSTCISWFPSKLAAGHGLKYSRLQDNHWTGSSGVGYCKIFKLENFSLLECF